MQRPPTPSHLDLRNIFSQGPVQDHARTSQNEDLTTSSTRFSRASTSRLARTSTDSHKTVKKGPWRGSDKIFIQAHLREGTCQIFIARISSAGSSFKDLFTRIFTRSSHKDLFMVLIKRFTRRHLRKFYKIIIEGPAIEKVLQDLCTRISYKSIPQELLDKHLQYRSSSRFSWKDLLERISPGSPQNLKTFQGPVYTRSRKDLLEDFTRSSTRSSHKDLYKTLVKIFITDLQQQDLLKGLHKIIQGPLRKDFAKVSTRSSHENLYMTTEGPPRGSLRDPPQELRKGTSTRPWSRYSCHVKLSTAAQRERSDTHKVLRGQREPRQNSHRATTRAKSREDCVSPNAARTTNY